MIKNGHVIISDHLFARFAASSPIIACDQERCRYANVLNSGNEAIYKTNMRGQQTKIHYLAISKHAPSSRATIAFIFCKNKPILKIQIFRQKVRL